MASIFIWTTLNIVLSVALVLSNKALVVHFAFKWMTFLSCLHFISSMLCTFALVKCGFIQKTTVGGSYIHVLRISLGSLLSVIFMNYCLAESSIGFYQVSKLVCIPTILLFERLRGVQHQTLTVSLVGSLGLVLVGMCLVVQNEIVVNMKGVIWGLLGVITTSLSQIFFGPLQKELGLDSIQLLYHTSPWLVIGSVAIMPLFEDTVGLISFKHEKSSSTMLVMSCAISVIFNVSNYQLLSCTSPLTYTIIGHIKTLIVILIGSYFFPTTINHEMYLGIGIAFVGAVVYKSIIDK